MLVISIHTRAQLLTWRPCTMTLNLCFFYLFSSPLFFRTAPGNTRQENHRDCVLAVWLHQPAARARAQQALALLRAAQRRPAHSRPRGNGSCMGGWASLYKKRAASALLSDGRPITGLEGTVYIFYRCALHVWFYNSKYWLRVKPGGVGTLSVYGLSLFLIAAYLCVFLMINYNIIIYTHNFLCR